MITSAELKTSIMEYALSGKTDYAIMITGKWGCGKTYFWKNDIQPILLRNNKRPIYISLYGVNKPSEINNLIAIEMFPLLKSSGAKILGRIGNSALKYFKIDSLVEGFSLAEYFNLENCFFCFDDLERLSSNDYKGVMGYINKFVEHNAIKTVIITDEEKIQHTDYKEIKEKVVGHTFKFTPSLDEIVERLIVDYRYQNEYTKFLIENKSTILNLIGKSKEHNIRILKQAIKRFSNLFAILKSQPTINRNIYNDLLEFTLAISFEIYSGKADIQLLEKFLQDRENYLDFIFTGKEDENKTYIDRFLDKYYDGWPKHNFFSMAVFYYVVDGFLNIDRFQSEILGIKQDEVDERKIMIERLQHWPDLSDTDFSALFTQALDYVKSGEIESPIRYLHLFNAFLFFNKEGLTTISRGELLEIFSKGLSRSFNEGKLIFVNHIEHQVYHSEPPDKEYHEFKTAIIQINDKLYDRTVEQKVISSVTELASNINKFIELISGNSTESLATTPVIKYINPEKFVAQINTLSNADLNQMWQSIELRYSSINIREFLKEDLEYLERIKTKIDEIIESQEITVKVALLKKMSNTISNACKKLNIPEA